MRVRANDIVVEVESSPPIEGAPVRPPVLLVMGLGMQLVSWPPAFVEALQNAGHRVVRFDNRDAGLSSQMDHLGTPNILWESLKHRAGFAVRAPYSLLDMAKDAIGVLDAFSIPRAHVVGVSLGGMVAQRIALAAPDRVLSLTSVMSSSGARYLPGPKPAVLQALLSRPRDRTEQALVEHYVRFFHIIGSPAFPLDEDALRQRITESVRRNANPAGTARQMAAVAADATRADELSGLRVPTLVVHGLADPLVPFACGQDTARRIPGARLVAVPGMGHDLPPGVVRLLLEALLPHLVAATPR